MVGVVTVAPACPSCGEAAGAGARFCESCGARLGPEVPPEATAPVGAGAAPADVVPPAGAARACVACGGEVAPDGYCLECGARLPAERDHEEERPAPHVGGVTDVGVRRRRNEDALALGAAGDVAVLVVCDGVASAPDSDRASRAGARTARDVLVAGVDGADDPEGWARLLVRAAAAADRSVRTAVDDAHARQDPPSCTFVAALARPGLVVTGWLGDSRAYWLPDEGPAEQLTEDDSLATELVASGVPRAEAERSRDAHAITRWLGADGPGTDARTAVRRPVGAGWLLTCSDGLWNYASGAADVAALVSGAVDRLGEDPVVVSRTLVDWAKAQGGHDNVTVALARVAAPPEEHDDPGTAPTATHRRPGSLPSEPGAPPPAP